MLYYTPKKEFDGQLIYTSKHNTFGYPLYFGELITPKELEKHKIPEKCVQQIFVKKNKTYFFFGKRFY